MIVAGLGRRCAELGAGRRRGRAPLGSGRRRAGACRVRGSRRELQPPRSPAAGRVAGPGGTWPVPRKPPEPAGESGYESSRRDARPAQPATPAPIRSQAGPPATRTERSRTPPPTRLRRTTPRSGTALPRTGLIVGVCGGQAPGAGTGGRRRWTSERVGSCPGRNARTYWDRPAAPGMVPGERPGRGGPVGDGAAAGRAARRTRTDTRATEGPRSGRGDDVHVAVGAAAVGGPATGRPGTRRTAGPDLGSVGASPRPGPVAPRPTRPGWGGAGLDPYAAGQPGRRSGASGGSCRPAGAGCRSGSRLRPPDHARPRRPDGPVRR